MERLKPCPFCGKYHPISLSLDPHYGHEQQIACGNRVVVAWTTDEQERKARAWWNTRPIEDRLAAQLQARERDRLELVRLRVQHEIDATALAEIQRIVTQALAGHGNDTAAWVEVERILDAAKEVEGDPRV